MTPAATERARELDQRLPPIALAGAEVGVWRGYMSAALLALRPTLTLFMVDHWRGVEGGPRGYRPEDSPANYAEALDNTSDNNLRRVIVPMASVQAARFIADESLDFVFLDADHSYVGVRDDINAWSRKVKRGGTLCGHDYGSTDYPGVQRAVDEAAQAHGWIVEIGRQTTWFVKL